MNISIAMTTYNGAKYLREQLQSFIDQTRQPDEVVVCDDGSIDTTLEILDTFRQLAPFTVHIYRNEKNLGYSKNFEKAMSLCAGAIIFLSDQDDVWLPDKIEKMLTRFEADSMLQLLIHDLEYCKEDLSPIGQTKIERMDGTFDLGRCYVVGMATAVRAPFLKLCLPIPQVAGIAHDDWLHACTWAIGRKDIMREVLALYRRHSSNVTAAGCLNVDFVTTPKHFKMNSANTLNLVQTKTKLGSVDIPPLIGWLQNNKNILVSDGYVSTERIDCLIREGIKRTENVRERNRIHSLPKCKRLFPVVMFFLRAGYKQYSGWKSALKDLLRN